MTSISFASEKALCVLRPLLMVAVSFLCLLSAAEARASSVPLLLPATAVTPELLVYPPQAANVSRPVVLFLHGMCGAPENECPLIADSITEQAWLVCPRGDAVCPGGGATWSYQKRRALPELVLAQVKKAFGERIDERGGHTLAGFSLGALAAVDAMAQGTTSFRHLVLIGAKVEPTVAMLQRCSVSDVVLMVGQWDMMYGHMSQKVRTLRHETLTTKFIDLGAVGHRLPKDINEKLRMALGFYSERIA
jgi:predicted esterase